MEYVGFNIIEPNGPRTLNWTWEGINYVLV